MNCIAEDNNFFPVLVAAVEMQGYKNPTAIQMQAIPTGLQSCDIVGLAEMGPGKSAAFVLPLLVYISMYK